MHPKIIYFCEAPKSKLLNYFGKEQLLRDIFSEIWRIKIQMNPQTSFEQIYGAFNLKNKVSAHGLGLVVQVS